MTSDADLLEAWRTGDDAAGRALFGRYFKGVYRFFANKVGHEIDDLVQETFLACVESKASVQVDGSLRAFVYAVARRRLYRMWRNRRAGAGAIDFGLTSVEDLGPSPSTHLRERREQAALRLALRKLPIELQVALELFYWEDLSSAELAVVLEIPRGTARSRLRRGREQLRELMAEIGDAELDEQVRALRGVVSPTAPATGDDARH